MPQPKKPATPSSSSGPSLFVPSSGGGQVLSLGIAPPPAKDIVDQVETAEIEWNLNFGYLRFTKRMDKGLELIEVANWVEELLEVEIVQFMMVTGSDVSFVVRKKRK